VAPLNLSTVGHGGTFGTPPKGVCPVCPAIGTPTRWDICPACPVCPAADVSALVDEISELTADKLCEVPQSSCSKRAPRGSPGISPGARRVSSDADTGADSTSAATRRLSYPQSGGCMLIASQYQCDGCDVPIRGPSAGPCPGARPSAHPARRPIGARSRDSTPHFRGRLQIDAGVGIRDRGVTTSLNRELLIFFMTCQKIRLSSRILGRRQIIRLSAPSVRCFAHWPMPSLCTRARLSRNP